MLINNRWKVYNARKYRMKVNETTIKSSPTALVQGTSSTYEQHGELQTLSAEVIDLFYTQAFSPEDFKTEREVCQAFAQILLRHWELCCIITYLRSDEEHLLNCAVYFDDRLPERKAVKAGALLAMAAERAGRETQVWLDASDEANSNGNETAQLRRALEETGARAGIAVPIHAHKALVGVLVVLSARPENLREALKGIRFVAAPIIIAVGNARRTIAFHEQRQHIQHLVEELQQHSAALEEANRELQRIARYRSLFLARMSHELRTPLTSVLGFVEILLDHEPLTAAQRRFCEKIQASGLQLQESLNQLVDLSRLEAGQTELFLHEFSLREVVRESCAAVARLAKKQEVRLERRFASDLASVVSDGGKLRQILHNFLAFAISRSPSNGRVRLSVEQADSAFFQIKICDIGDALADPAYLFEPTDADAPNERGTNMNELGLVIAARLVKVLGGTITLDAGATDLKASTTKRGLCVRLRFPSRPSDATTT